jgi:hypothetical protein
MLRCGAFVVESSAEVLRPIGAMRLSMHSTTARERDGRVGRWRGRSAAAPFWLPYGCGCSLQTSCGGAMSSEVVRGSRVPG